jgi:abortive infection bacteriophage resistance protein
MSPLKPSKPYCDYSSLVDRLEDRGMIISDKSRAVRKLSQIGYYRLSGFWYPCRKGKVDDHGEYVTDPKTNLPVREDKFQDNVCLDDVVALYLFDKKLRQLMLDAIERVEIQIRTVIANVMGYYSPIAYENGDYINPIQRKNFYDKQGNVRNAWSAWCERHNGIISRSKEDCITWHIQNRKELPFWAVVEAWDFGIMSKYFEILNGKFQEAIARKVGVRDKTCLVNWLQTINTLRNRCAHHTRIWNRSWAAPLKPDSKSQYFEDLKLTTIALQRNYGMICVLWYLIKTLGPSSDWLAKVADLVDTKPQLACCPFSAMGLPDEKGFPRANFGLPITKKNSGSMRPVCHPCGKPLFVV